MNGKATKLVKPIYPQAAKDAKDSGIVNVQVTIDEEGNVISATAGSGPMSLRKVSEDAALASKFSPTKLSGQLVKVSGVIVYRFTIDAGTELNNNKEVINGEVINGKAIRFPKPKYPAAAKVVRASGAVNVQVTIDEKGEVIAAKAVSGHPLLLSSAEEAASGARFSPTLKNGQPTKITGVIVYNFIAPRISSKKSKIN